MSSHAPSPKNYRGIAMTAENSSQRRLKTELHLHLEGALTAERAFALADAAIDVPSAPPDSIVGLGASARWSFNDLGEFLQLFGWGTRLLRTPDSYALVLGDLAASLSRDEVEYAEVFVAFGQMYRVGVDPRAVMPVLATRARELEEQRGPSLHFIADATRQWGVVEAERVLDLALELQSQRIVGFSLGGDERAVAAREFCGIYRRAAASGLGLACHAGEGTGPEAVRAVVEELGVSRVGHGIAAVQDPSLLRELAEGGVTLEVCPTSNECTGAWRSSEGAHPVLELLESEVSVVLGSDDPAFFACSLASEEARLARWGVSDERLQRMEEDARAARFTAD
jgi:aminodeoxyfutalosine deaminase